MISVIVPFKDAEPWIKRCADSLHDNAGDFEFIFIDDHSVDSSNDIVAGYDDDRFVVVDNRHRPGVSGARNTGIDVARGSWITFLDADDVMLPNAAKKFNKMLKTKSDIHQSNHSRRYRASGRTVTKYKNKEGFYSLGNLDQCNCWRMVWNKLIRARVLSDIRFDEALVSGEDEMFVLECLSKTGVIHHSSCITTLHCFDNENSLIHTKTDEDLWRQVYALENFIKAHNDALTRKAACKVLSEHWSSKTFLNLIGGANET